MKPSAFALSVALGLCACGGRPPPEAPPEPPPAPPSAVASSKAPAVIATSSPDAPDAGRASPSVEAKKRRVLDLMQGKVPESELKVDSIGE